MNRPVPLLRQKDDEGLDYHLKDRQYLQQESEMNYTHHYLRGCAGGGLPAGISTLPSFHERTVDAVALPPASQAADQTLTAEHIRA
jgi:hypothetical protein